MDRNRSPATFKGFHRSSRDVCLYAVIESPVQGLPGERRLEIAVQKQIEGKTILEFRRTTRRLERSNGVIYGRLNRATREGRRGTCESRVKSPEVETCD